MNDALTAEIEKVQADRERAYQQAQQWQRQVEMYDVQLDALKRAAELRPIRHGRSEGNVSGKGRQPGAISKRWRGILLLARATFPKGATPTQVAEIARNSGIPNIRDRDANERMKQYEGHGYVEATPYGWRITDQAFQRFSAEQGELSDTASVGDDAADDELEDAA